MAMKKILMLALTSSLILGVITCIVGFLRNDPSGDGYGEAGKPLVIAGAIMTGVPVIVFWLIFVTFVVRQLSASARAYRAWRQTLSPDQLAKVRIAEAATLAGGMLMAGHELHRLREWERASDARVTQTQVSGFGPPWSG